MKEYNFKTAAALYLSAFFVISLCAVTLKHSSKIGSLSIFQAIFIKTFAMTAVLTPIYLKKIFSIQKKHIPLLVLSVILAIFDTYVANISWTKLPINNATIIAFIQPFVMTLLAWLILGEKISPKHIIAMFIAFFSILVSIDFKKTGLFDEIYWYALLFLNLFVASISWITIKKLSKHYSTNLIIYIRTFVIFLCSVATLDSLPSLNQDSWHIMLIIVFGYFYERLTIAKVYSMVDISKIQPLKFTNIIFSSTLGYFILGEHLTQNQIFSVILIIMAMFISYKKRN